MDAPENCSPDKVPWDALPNESWVEIFSWLDIEDLGIAARVCKRWESLASDEMQWKSRFFANWHSDKKSNSEFSWRSECKRFLHHVPSVEATVFLDANNMIRHLSFSKNGKFIVSCSTTCGMAKISIWKTDSLEVLVTFEEKMLPLFVELNDTGDLLLVVCVDWQLWKAFFHLYRFDPTETAGNGLTLVDRQIPAFPPIANMISWLDSSHYLVGMCTSISGCLIQVYSATHQQRDPTASYYFQCQPCRMLLAAELPSGEKTLVFSSYSQLNSIFVKNISVGEVSSFDRPSKPDHCISMEGTIMGIALLADKKTLIINCRKDNSPMYTHSGPCELQLTLVDLVTMSKLPRHPLMGPVSDGPFKVSLPVCSGTLIACSSSDGFVYIYDTGHNCCIRRLPHKNQITALAWNPVDEEMLLTANGGKISIWKSCNRTQTHQKI